MISRLTQLTLVVEDQNEALKYYTETLGFEKQRDNSMGPVRFLTVAPEGEEDVEIVLQSLDQFEDAERREAMIGQSPGLGFAVDDCQATYEELQERGVEFVSDPEEMPWATQAVATDLYGNPIILYEYTNEAR